MNYTEIKRLVKLVESSDIGELEIEESGSRLRIAKATACAANLGPMVQPMVLPQIFPNPQMVAPSVPSSIPAAESSVAARTPAKKLHEVQSPMVGTYYRAPAPEAPPYVQVGDMVRPGQVLCIIEAMKLMNEIESEVSGLVVDILIENAQPVEFGQTLFRIEPV